MYFTDKFKVTKKDLSEYGAVNISMIVDRPLFIDPLLIFHNQEKYKVVYDRIVNYLEFL